MRPGFAYDDEDPFGSRPDEKPPRGWDVGFWREVKDRIESGGRDPDSAEPPPARPRPRAVGPVAGIVVAGAVAAAALLPAAPRSPAPPGAEPPTLVLVDGSRNPAVRVEWARRGGRESSVVVLETYGPETSYLVLERAGPAALESPGAREAIPAREDASPVVLVSLLRGERGPRDAEVHVTTVFGERSFVLPAGEDAGAPTEDEVAAQARTVFSLRSVAPLGSSILPLSGGTALLEDSGRRASIRIEGTRAGAGSVRLVVTLMQDGREPVATSVVALIGRAVVLTGPDPAAAEGSLFLVRLTPLAGPQARTPAVI